MKLSTVRSQLFLTGFAILFLELACIRWFSAYVVFLQFFTNIILVACFLGMSIGCMCAGRPADWLARFARLSFYTILLAVTINVLYFYWSGLAIDVGNQSSPEVIFFGTEYRQADVAGFVIPMEVLAGLFFVLIALMFVGPGQVLGRCFDAYPKRVTAYTLNIAGSLAGIAAFAAVSFLQLPAVVWFVVGFSCIGVLLRQNGTLARIHVCYMLGALVVVGWTGTKAHQGATTRWSPYYAVRYHEPTRSVAVNNISHQQMIPRAEGGSVYSLVHLLSRDSGAEPFGDVLIVGAGSGNDVAHALAAGAEHIDAVEIDPVILDLGRHHHPDDPYGDPRVRTVVDDGRHFLRTADRKYDLAVFALVDSLILHSSYSNIRLESFLFTEEAFRDVRDRLKDHGVFVTYNYFRRGWLVQRIHGMLTRAFGSEPLVFSLPYDEAIAPGDDHRGRWTVFVAGSTAAIRSALAQHGQFWLHRNPLRSAAVNGFDVRPAAGDEAWSRIGQARIIPSGTPLIGATDSWPFLYLRSPMLPNFYVRGMLMIAGLGLSLVYVFSPQRQVRVDGRMFFLGAGFMLLEAKAVVHLALVFGSTWLVNSLVFFSILVMILGSNLYVLKAGEVRIQRHYTALFACLLLNCVVPFDVFLEGGVLWRYVAPCVLTMTPVFFAGVIFARCFRDSRRPDLDFGSNIAGAVVGGVAEYCSMVLGFRYLLLVGVLLYLLSALPRRRGALPVPAAA